MWVLDTRNHSQRRNRRYRRRPNRHWILGHLRNSAPYCNRRCNYWWRWRRYLGNRHRNLRIHPRGSWAELFKHESMDTKKNGFPSQIEAIEHNEWRQSFSSVLCSEGFLCFCVAVYCSTSTYLGQIKQLPWLRQPPIRQPHRRLLRQKTARNHERPQLSVDWQRPAVGIEFVQPAEGNRQVLKRKRKKSHSYHINSFIWDTLHSIESRRHGL